MRFLIADGDKEFAENLAGWFLENGWPRPGVASSAVELRAWVEAAGGCDILVMSTELPGAGVGELYAELKAISAKLVAIFLTEGDPGKFAESLPGLAVLKKPVNGLDVDDAIRAAFGESSGRGESDREAGGGVGAEAGVVADSGKGSEQASGPTAPVPKVAVAVPKVAVGGQGVKASVPRVVRAQPKVVSNVARATVPKASEAGGQDAVGGEQGERAVGVVAVKPTVVAGIQQAKVKVPSAILEGTCGSPDVAKTGTAGGGTSETFVSVETELAPDELVGKRVGDYEVEAKIGTGRMGPIYRARQVSMNRLVRLYVLDWASKGDAGLVQQFLANASAKANANNPILFAIYEAGESDGYYFYSCEYESCSSLQQIYESGRLLDEGTALKVLEAAGRALNFLSETGIRHDAVTARSILITDKGEVRMANLAASEPMEELDVAGEILRLAEIVVGMLSVEGPKLGVRQFLERVLAGGGPVSWLQFLQHVEACKPKHVPKDAYKLEAQERAALRVLEESRKQQKKKMVIGSLISLSILSAVLASFYFVIFRDKGGEFTDFDRMIEIPGGEFIYQDGERVNLPTFYIDEYEVTIGQYAKFLEWVEKNPEEAAKLAHEKMPKGKSHVPQEWADMKELNPPMPGYYTRAKRWGRYQESPLTLNSPVFGVDWFDAYAYAKWKGRRLPTEQEWEKAARGVKGNLFPWGNEPNHAFVNSGQDLDPNPKKGGDIDGWKRWSPVDAKKEDRSEFGVKGMAGNVSEWTATFDTDPQMSSSQVPVIRGGNWRNPDYRLTRRVLLLTELQSDNALGFRTVSDTPPAKK